MSSQVQIGVSVLGAQSAGQQLQQLGTSAATVQTRVNQLSARREFMAGQRLQSSITGMLGVNNALTQSIDGFERLGYMAESSGMKIGQFLKTIGPGALATAGAVAGVTAAWRAWNGELDKTNSNLERDGFKKLTGGQFAKWMLLGMGPKMEVDPKAMYAKTVQEANGHLSAQVEFEKQIAKATDLSRSSRVQLLRAIEEQVDRAKELQGLEKELANLQRKQPDRSEPGTVAELDQRMKELPGLIEGARATALAPQVPQSWRDDAARRGVEMQIELEQLRLKRPPLERAENKTAVEKRTEFAEKVAGVEQRIADIKGKNWYEGLRADEKRLALVQRIAALEMAARWSLNPLTAAEYRLKAQEDRGKVAEMAREKRADTLRPWMDEAKNPKGFAETTLSNSLEGVKAVAEAATAGERRDATLSAMQDQIRLLQDIRTNTGNATQPTTVGPL